MPKPNSQPQLPITSEAVRYGLGVFETVVVRFGRAEMMRRHWKSLCQGAQALGLPEPDLKAIHPLPERDGLWRWLVVPEGTFHFFEPCTIKPPKELTLSVSPIRLSSQSWDARYKTLSYLPHLQARRQAQSGEVIMLNEHGHIASASMANIFWFVDGGWKTPALECGCRAGVVRQWLLEAFPVEQGAWPVQEIYRASSILLTNSRIGLCPGRLLPPAI